MNELLIVLGVLIAVGTILFEELTGARVFEAVLAAVAMFGAVFAEPWWGRLLFFGISVALGALYILRTPRDDLMGGRG